MTCYFPTLTLDILGWLSCYKNYFKFFPYLMDSKPARGRIKEARRRSSGFTSTKDIMCTNCRTRRNRWERGSLACRPKRSMNRSCKLERICFSPMVSYEGPYYSWFVCVCVCVSVRNYVCEQLFSEMAEVISTKFH